MIIAQNCNNVKWKNQEIDVSLKKTTKYSNIGCHIGNYRGA